MDRSSSTTRSRDRGRKAGAAERHRRRSRTTCRTLRAAKQAAPWRRLRTPTDPAATRPQDPPASTPRPSDSPLAIVLGVAALAALGVLLKPGAHTNTAQTLSTPTLNAARQLRVSRGSIAPRTPQKRPSRESPEQRHAQPTEPSARTSRRRRSTTRASRRRRRPTARHPRARAGRARSAAPHRPPARGGPG